MFYRIFRKLAGAALRLFFRRIEVEGLGDVPESGAVLLVSNHSNALVDPLLPVILLRRHVTLTAKNVLARNPLLGLLARGLGAVLFHRAADVDKGADPRQNTESLARCGEILQGGGAIAIFPEGVSHSDLKMRPFRTGVARIALDFVAVHPGSALHLVPIGLHYTGKARFRSEVWVRFGPPLDVGAWRGGHPGADADALTDEVRQRIERQVLSFESREEMVVLHYVAEIMATQGRMPRALGSAEPAVAEWFRSLALLQDGYRKLVALQRPEIDALSERVRTYRSELKRLGVEPAEVYLPLHSARAALFLVRELELFVVGAPLAAFGALNHLVPYLAVRSLARALSKDRDQWASNVVYPSLVIFPVYSLAILGAVWATLPAFWAAVYTVALPYTGYYALLYGDRTAGAWRRARTFVYWLFHRSRQSRLAQEGREILAAVHALGAELEAEAS
jgi:glycerol-3-phosphate O-acyltransferase/dihydroxyacetone phosphate acyltransferase